MPVGIRLPPSLRRFVASSLILLFLPGCGSARQPSGPKEGRSAQINSWLASQPVSVPAMVYRIEPPDKLRILAPTVKEIDKQEVIVRPDGKINLNLIGELPVRGLTPAEVSDLIAQKLSKYYTAGTMDVAVQVAEFKSRVYYVFGQVMAPGIKPYTGTDTIVKVLADARLNEQAWPQRVVIVRPNEDPTVKQRVTVDLKEMQENGKTDQNFIVEPGDVIFVPPSPLADIAMTFKKVLFPIVPATNIGMMALRGGV
jgi:polysaccharide biosynthesis/export protein